MELKDILPIHVPFAINDTFTLLFALCIPLLFYNCINRYSSAKALRLVQSAAKARQDRDNKDHSACFDYFEKCNYTTDAFSDLTASDIATSGDYDPRDLVATLSAKCSQELSYRNPKGINAIAEELYSEGYSQAMKNSRLSNPPSGVLSNVPISVKDCIGVVNCLQTGGLAVRTLPEHRSNKDSVLVQTLRKQGAIPIVRGNVSQCMMLPESANNVWGESLNPWDLTRTPGGSSGGEGALVSTRCVPLAVGSDVGGSIRIPAAFCGICGFKPTPGRVSKKGCMAPRRGNRHGPTMVIPSTPGPLARTVEDCKLFCKAVWRKEHFEADTDIVPKVYDGKVFESKRKLKLAYFKTDGWFHPCQAALRGLEETVVKLREEGHEVNEVEFPGDGGDTYALYVALAAAEGNMRCFEEGLEGEELIKPYKVLKMASSLPNFLRPIVALVMNDRRSRLVKAGRSGGLSAYEYWERLADLNEMRSMWSERIADLNVDGFIHVGLPLPALKCGTSGDLTGVFSYTLLANLLLWPAGTVPVTTIREDEQHYNFSDIPESQRDHWGKKAQEQMEGSKGLPLSVAVMTPKYHDEMCLRIMEEVERVAKFSDRPQAYL